MVKQDVAVVIKPKIIFYIILPANRRAKLVMDLLKYCLSRGYQKEINVKLVFLN